MYLSCVGVDRVESNLIARHSSLIATGCLILQWCCIDSKKIGNKFFYSWKIKDHIQSYDRFSDKFYKLSCIVNDPLRGQNFQSKGETLWSKTNLLKNLLCYCYVSIYEPMYKFYCAYLLADSFCCLINSSKNLWVMSFVFESTNASMVSIVSFSSPFFDDSNFWGCKNMQFKYHMEYAHSSKKY